MEKAYLKLAQVKSEYKELRNLQLRNPKDVYKLHMFVKEKGIKDRSLELLLRDSNATRLPNIMFDITMKDAGDITDVLPQLLAAGYDPKNIHLTWVLTNYAIAIQNNRNRERVVPEDIMLLSHEGACNQYV